MNNSSWELLEWSNTYYITVVSLSIKQPTHNTKIKPEQNMPQVPFASNS